MERKKMAHAIGLIAWGYLFLYFNLNLSPAGSVIC